MANVLIVGGAGYIGSATGAWLEDHGHTFTVLDDLSTGFRELVRNAPFVEARAGDHDVVSKLLMSQSFDCVMHFAARALISECFEKEAEYRENNVEQTRRLLDTLVAHGVKRFVFSSTCAVYGAHVGTDSISETTPTNPVNPYGETKLLAEQLLAQYAKTHALQAIALRYFNAAGAEAKLRCGELHDPETHLIPIVLRAALSGETVSINGADYPTFDGTCVRDYIHVSDLAQAHMAAMERLLSLTSGEGSFDIFNLGTERGASILEVIAAAEKVTGRSIRTEIRSPRRGDPPRLVASTEKARRVLGFDLRSSDLNTILSSALAWELREKRND